MSDTESKPIEVVTLIVAILNILVMGIGGYVFVGKQQADMFSSTTSLNSIRSELTKMQLKIAESNSRIDTLSKSADLAEKSIFLLEAIKPSFDFSIEGKMLREGNALTITFNLVNNGKFELKVVPTNFFITRTPIRNNLEISDHKNTLTEELVLNKIDTIRSLSGEEKRGHTFTVNFKKDPPSNAYYYMEYSVETNQDVVKIVDTVARQWGVTSVNNDSKSIVYRYGRINL